MQFHLQFACDINFTQIQLSTPEFETSAQEG
jgi:hypothetical protein